MTSIRTVYKANCNRCGWTFEQGVEATVALEARSHDQEHEGWRLIGRQMTGLVYDIDAPASPYAGFITKAVEQAEGAGFRFLAWNGWVYRTDDALGRKVCMASDVPDLTAWGKQ
jgi:hypothetical protein